MKTLKQDFTVTEAILRVGVARPNFFSNPYLTRSQESKAGLAVGKLRQHASKEVADFAKDLVKKWKSQVEKDKLSAGGGKVQPNGKGLFAPFLVRFTARYFIQCQARRVRQRPQLQQTSFAHPSLTASRVALVIPHETNASNFSTMVLPAMRTLVSLLFPDSGCPMIMLLFSDRANIAESSSS